MQAWRPEYDVPFEEMVIGLVMGTRLGIKIDYIQNRRVFEIWNLKGEIWG